MKYLVTRGWFGYAFLATVITVQTTIVFILKDISTNADTNAKSILANSVVRPDSPPIIRASELPTTPFATPLVTPEATQPSTATSKETVNQTEPAPIGLEQNCENTRENFTVRIIDQTSNGGREIGSGILISGTEVLTAFHVVKRQGSITVEFADGKSFDAIYIGSDKGKDLALLRLEADPGKFATPINIASATPESNEGVCAIGSPYGAPLRIAVGKVLTVNERGDVLLTPGLLHPGDSGGPLINSEGTLVGLNRAVIKLRNNHQPSALQDETGVAVSPESIRKFLAENNTTRKS